MTATPASPDPDELMLARLAELDLAAAEKAHARLMAAEEPDEVAGAGRTYQRMARSLRQTLALKARLKHDRERAAREAAQAPVAARPVGGVAVARRIEEVTAAVLRVAWRHEPERESFDWYVDGLEGLMLEDRGKPDFGVEPLDDHVARLCLALGLPAEMALAWRDLPEPPPEAERDAERDAGPATGPSAESEPPWRSSA